MRASRKTRFVLLLAVAIVVLLMVRAFGPVAFRMLVAPSGVRVTISKETTHIVQPLRSDGCVDYVAALNERLSRGVTPDNNAVVLLLKAIGPRRIGEAHREKYFRLLGIPPLPEDGEYFVTIFAYSKGRKALSERSCSTNEAMRNVERVVQESLKQVDDAFKSGKFDPKKDEEYILFDQLTKGLRRPWSEKEFPRLAGWLRANEKPLALAVEATKRPRRFDPVVCEDGGMCLAFVDGLSDYKYVGEALAARSMLRTEKGDVDGALDDLLACHRLARLVGQGPSLVDQLFAIGIARTAWGADAALLGHVQLTARQAARIPNELDKMPPMTTVAEAIDGCERYLFLDGVGIAARGQIGPLLGDDGAVSKDAGVLRRLSGRWQSAKFDWDMLLRICNPWFDRIVDACGKPTRAERQAAFQAVNAAWKKTERSGWRAGLFQALGDQRKVNSQRLARETVTDYLSAFCFASKEEDAGVMKAQLGRLAFALAAYRADHGRYPAKLAQLSPAYVAEIPKDFFDNDSDLRYRPQGDGYILYSVGVNGKDDGGRSEDERDFSRLHDECDDIVVRVPAAR